MKESSLSELDSTQIEQAIASCLQQIAANPKKAELYVALGHLYAQQQQWQRAIKNFQQALTLKPDFAEIHRYLAAVLSQNGNDSLAANHLFKAAQLQPNSLSAQQYFKFAQTLQQQAKPARAIACYRSAIAAQPDFWHAYITLATLLTQQGKEERALEVYRQGVRHNPQNSNYYFALASALAARQKWVRASNNYQQAAKLAPSAKIYFHWGIAEYELHAFDQARSHFQQAAELAPSPEIYYHWGLTLTKLDQAEQAVSSFQRAINLKADYAAAYYQLGLIWQQLQQWHQAVSAYKRFLALDSQPKLALINLGLAYRSLQQYDLSLACYHEAIKRLPKGAALETEVFAGYQQTLAEYSQVTHNQYYQFAKLLRSRSRFPDAIAAYSQSIKLDPHFKNTYIDLQYTPVAPKQAAELIDLYRQIVAEHPEITIAWGNLGDVLTQQNLVTEAIDCYRKGSYQKAIQTYPYLAKLNWQPEKKSAPDFIIAGASKSGTSSIYYYLGRHPQVLLPHKKEIDFYWSNYQRGIEWYLAHFPTITDQDNFLTGEATPNYLRFPQVAQRIKDTFPKTKIIILLRNPVDRAISWHYHKLNTGLTKVNLETAIATEIERLASISEAEITHTGFYEPDNIISSLYIYKIKPWIELLGREQFLILKSEDFYLDPVKNMETVFEFLKLPNCTLENYPQVNPGTYNQVDFKLRKTLSDYFAPYNQQLEEYLGMNFHWK
ncbi:MAG: tetratricopeptide repeat protein [Cyanobacteria bacterium P01_G01_bin.67]